MKKIELTLVLVLVCFLMLALVVNEQELWAKSKSKSFEMKSDALYETGGKSQSPNFKLLTSAKAQPSLVADQSKIKKVVPADRGDISPDSKVPSKLKQNLARSSSPLKRDFQEPQPEHFSLSQNYPNPFNPETEISYALPTDCHVKLSIYNIAGRKVKTLIDQRQTAGYKTVYWNGKDDKGKEIATGVYFYRIQAGDFSQSRKMVLLR
jgi:hypothetical protein